MIARKLRNGMIIEIIEVERDYDTISFTLKYNGKIVVEDTGLSNICMKIMKDYPKFGRKK